MPHFAAETRPPPPRRRRARHRGPETSDAASRVENPGRKTSRSASASGSESSAARGRKPPATACRATAPASMPRPSSAIVSSTPRPPGRAAMRSRPAARLAGGAALLRALDAVVDGVRDQVAQGTLELARDAPVEPRLLAFELDFDLPPQAARELAGVARQRAQRRLIGAICSARTASICSSPVLASRVSSAPASSTAWRSDAATTASACAGCGSRTPSSARFASSSSRARSRPVTTAAARTRTARSAKASRPPARSPALSRRSSVSRRSSLARRSRRRVGPAASARRSSPRGAPVGRSGPERTRELACSGPAEPSAPPGPRAGTDAVGAAPVPRPRSNSCSSSVAARPARRPRPTRPSPPGRHGRRAAAPESGRAGEHDLLGGVAELGERRRSPSCARPPSACGARA